MTAGIESGVRRLLFSAGKRDTAMEWQSIANFEPLFEEGLTILDAQSQEVGKHWLELGSVHVRADRSAAAALLTCLGSAAAALPASPALLESVVLP